MVISEIASEKSLEMAFVENNHMIQTLSSNGADNALDIGVLPSTPRRDGTIFHSQTPNTFSKVLAVDGIAIAPQILRWWLPREGLNKLLRRLFGRWMFCQIRVDDLPSIMSQDDEHE